MHELRSGLFPAQRGAQGAGDAFLRPDWVIIGAQNGAHGVMILASRTLTDAELTMKAREPEAMRTEDWFFRMKEKPIITVKLQMDDFIMIHAQDYPTALQALFDQWAPTGSAPGAVRHLPAIGR